MRHGRRLTLKEVAVLKKIALSKRDVPCPTMGCYDVLNLIETLNSGYEDEQK